MRIAFDLDGVLADLQTVLGEAAERLYGKASAATQPDPALFSEPPNGELPQSAQPTPDDEPVPPQFHELSATEQARLWQRVLETENFWETLSETEPGIVGRLAMLASDRRWEVLFITQRPSSNGDTCQVQSQRWLARHGFSLPSVFVIRGPRGKVAAALDLDVVVDDRPDNCLDVVIESKARAFLVWRGDPSALAAVSAKRLNIDVVASVGECLDRLTEQRDDKPGLFGRLKRLIGST